MKVVQRYPLEIKEFQVISFPKKATILSVTSENEVIVLYALVNVDEEEKEERKIRLIETDEEVENNIVYYIFLKTITVEKKSYHVFLSEKVEIKEDKKEYGIDHMWGMKRPSYQTSKPKGAKESEKDNIRTYYYSIDEYIKAWGKEIDYDMVIIFRWDWSIHTEQNGNAEYIKKFGNNCETLEIYCYQQQTEKLFLDVIKVKKDEEEKIKAFLQPFLKHIQKIWYPLV